MTEKQNSLYPDDWKNSARRDWRRMSVLLHDGDSEGTAFFLQQSLEKYLKAFLIGHGWKLRKLHNLDTLLDHAIGHDAALETFMNLCERVSGHYFAERYPMLLPSDLSSAILKKI